MNSRRIEIILLISVLIFLIWIIVDEIRYRERLRLDMLTREHFAVQQARGMGWEASYKNGGSWIERLAQGRVDSVRCTFDSCLTPGLINDNTVYGTARVTGYYTTTNQTSQTGEKTCSSLVVIDAPSVLSDFFLEHSSRITGISKNQEEESVVAIDTAYLDESQKEVFSKSSKAEPVEILLLKKRGDGGVAGCYFPVDALNVRKHEEKNFGPTDDIGP